MTPPPAAAVLGLAAALAGCGPSLGYTRSAEDTAQRSALSSPTEALTVQAVMIGVCPPGSPYLVVPTPALVRPRGR